MPSQSDIRTARRVRPWLVLGIGLVAGPLLLAGVAASWALRCIHAGPDALALRDAMALDHAVAWPKPVEFNVGRLPMALARLGLGFAPLPVEARALLRSTRSLEVIVHEAQIRERSSSGNHPEPFDASDRAMSERGWDRLVGVSHLNGLIVVYLARSSPSEREARICLAVNQDCNLVIVAARVAIEPLLDIARRRGSWSEPVPLLSTAP